MTIRILYPQHVRDNDQEFGARGLDRSRLPVFEIRSAGLRDAPRRYSLHVFSS